MTLRFLVSSTFKKNLYDVSLHANVRAVLSNVSGVAIVIYCEWVLLLDGGPSWQ